MTLKWQIKRLNSEIRTSSINGWFTGTPILGNLHLAASVPFDPNPISTCRWVSTFEKPGPRAPKISEVSGAFWGDQAVVPPESCTQNMWQWEIPALSMEVSGSIISLNGGSSSKPCSGHDTEGYSWMGWCKWGILDLHDHWPHCDYGWCHMSSVSVIPPNHSIKDSRIPLLDYYNPQDIG